MDLGGMNNIQNKAIQSIGESVQGQPAGPSGLPGENDVERFRDAMEKGETSPAETANAPEPPPPDPAGESPPVDMGTRIIQGMAKVSDSIQTSRKDATSVMTKSDVTQAELLRASFGMLESSTMVSAVSKTTEKITQSVKTLQQG